MNCSLDLEYTFGWEKCSRYKKSYQNHRRRKQRREWRKVWKACIWIVRGAENDRRRRWRRKSCRVEFAAVSLDRQPPFQSITAVCCSSEWVQLTRHSLQLHKCGQIWSSMDQNQVSWFMDQYYWAFRFYSWIDYYKSGPIYTHDCSFKTGTNLKREIRDGAST